MVLSMFREANTEDGKPGPYSMRRVLAFLLSLAAIGLFILGFNFKDGWFVFIPGMVCLAAVLLLLFFTTWGDVAEIAKAIKK